MSHTRCEEEWRQLSWIVGCALATGYLDDEPPVSLMLLGRPGTGKSSLMSRWYSDATALVVSDITSDSLRHLVLPQMASEGRRHLMFPEFFKLFQRSQSAVANMTGVLSAAMSGELHTVIQGERTMEKLPADFRIGAIAAMTDGVFGLWKKDFGNTGLLDRFLMVHLTLSHELTRHMLHRISMGDRTMLAPLHLPLAVKSKHRVTMSPAASEALYEMVLSVDGHTHRFMGAMRAMVKALALCHGEHEVTALRLHGIQNLMRYLSSKKPLGESK